MQNTSINQVFNISIKYLFLCSVSSSHQVADSHEILGHLVLCALPGLAVLRQDNIGGEGAVTCNFLLQNI